MPDGASCSSRLLRSPCTSFVTSSRYGSRSGAVLSRAGPRVPRLARALGRACCSRSGSGRSSFAWRRPARARATRRRAARSRRSGRCRPSPSSRSTPPRSGSRARSRPGIPAGLAGVFGHGGWWALPLAVAFGARRGAAAPGRLGRRRDGRAGSRRRPAPAAAVSGFSRPAEAIRSGALVLAGNSSGRAPPGTSPATAPSPPRRSHGSKGDPMRKPLRLRTAIPVVLAALALPAQAAAHGRAATIALDYRLALSTRDADALRGVHVRVLDGDRDFQIRVDPGTRARRSRGAAGAAAAGSTRPACGSTRARRRRPSDRLVSRDQARLGARERRSDRRLARPPALAAAREPAGPGRAVRRAGRRQRRARTRSRETFFRVARPGLVALASRPPRSSWPGSCSRSGAGALRAPLTIGLGVAAGVAALLEVTTFAVRDATYRRSRVAPARDGGGRRRGARGAARAAARPGAGARRGRRRRCRGGRQPQLDCPCSGTAS